MGWQLGGAGVLLLAHLVDPAMIWLRVAACAGVTWPACYLSVLLADRIAGNHSFEPPGGIIACITVFNGMLGLWYGWSASLVVIGLYALLSLGESLALRLRQDHRHG